MNSRPMIAIALLPVWFGCNATDPNASNSQGSSIELHEGEECTHRRGEDFDFVTCDEDTKDKRPSSSDRFRDHRWPPDWDDDNDNDDSDDDDDTSTLPGLSGRAVLAADTFASGPAAGEFIGEVFPGQPVQGVSAMLANPDGSFLAMSDNGFGSLENSADYHLRVYRLRPEFETRSGGTGQVWVEAFFELHDPDHHIKWATVNHFSRERVLTGADFDIESLQRGEDGTLWFGDEFGPFLLHTDPTGKLLEAPIPLPDFENPGQSLRSPQNPFLEEGSAARIMNAVRSHARSFGAYKPPVFSPWHVHLIDDVAGPNRGFNGQRDAENLSGTGLRPANDEIFDIAFLQASGYPIVTWTVNDKARMLELMTLGVNGIISDRPDLLLEAVLEFDADGDGVGGDFLDEDGLIDITRFDAQGHRGARNLRPENTLPAMEVALDTLVTTLELDCGLTEDLVPVLYHDREFQTVKSRRKLGGALPEFLVEVPFDDIQHPVDPILNDGVFRGAPQSNDPSLSPVARRYVTDVLGRSDAEDIYLMPALAQVFDFVDFYIEYYEHGPGSTTVDAVRRVANARRVRFNVETKLNPRFPETTHEPNEFVAAIGELVLERGLQDRADIQSFDFRTLLEVHEVYPRIRTVFLFGDFSICPTGQPGGTFCDDGTNLQPSNINRPVLEPLADTNNTPWMAGLYWPYRRTTLDFPTRVARSGGFEGMAISPDGSTLYPLLERPIADGNGALLIHEFDIASRSYTGRQMHYPLEPDAAAIGDFVLFSETNGLVIERDGTQGDLDGWKRIFEITFQGDGDAVTKTERIDLLRIPDPNGISLGAELPGDTGLGDPFAFPFVTIESVVVLDSNRILVANDNNYPFSVGRHTGLGLPDDNEFIVIQLEQPLE